MPFLNSSREGVSRNTGSRGSRERGSDPNSHLQRMKRGAKPPLVVQAPRAQMPHEGGREKSSDTPKGTGGPKSQFAHEENVGLTGDPDLTSCYPSVSLPIPITDIPDLSPPASFPPPPHSHSSPSTLHSPKLLSPQFSLPASLIVFTIVSYNLHWV
ncbi:BRCA1-A complex subunit Abraxas [Platysternon megacephalum]|uniref:BRCA1-A complex subunit Abraxas n=1 Tax=Platysternon megacephalum TaxID=55544 RepID=A0A4D9E7K9_9SAUR|nr:BRCA1-A complex subunit Abraxas [Platysternon megacephalum]